MIKIMLFAALTMMLIVLVNFIFYKLITKRALNRYILPKLKEQGYSFVESKYPGFLNTGDFNESVLQILPFTQGIYITAYQNIYYLDQNQKLRTTARITVLFGFIQKVELNGM